MQSQLDTASRQDFYSLLWAGLVGLVGAISPFIAFAITASASAALFPPKTKMQVFGLLACCAGSFFYVGALVIDRYGYQGYSQDAKDGIRFFCAVPMWMLLQIVAAILTKWRDAKDPVSKISSDVKKIRKW